MSGPNHSPAPFQAALIDDTFMGRPNRRLLIKDALGDSIAGMALQTGDHPQEEQQANASLLLGAPRLLAAAKALLHQAEGRDAQYWPELDELREAVTDAEGRALTQALTPDRPRRRRA